MKTILLCSDLDRTLIPNGPQEESPQARPAFRHMAAHRKMHLAYVSGRDKALVKAAIEDYMLPEPDFVIGDVGTTLYHVVGGRWHLDESWQEEIGKDWKNCGRDDITELLENLKLAQLELQPPEKQGRFKISFFTGPSTDDRRLTEVLFDHLAEYGIAANVIWSFDDAAGHGLLDILPCRADKLHAIQFLIKTRGMEEEATVFAGDSGNDLDVLTSGMQAILVRNASDDVRQTVLNRVAESGKANRLYQAQGCRFDMNGNYAAGVLEGLAHFFPETSTWIETATSVPGNRL